MFGHDPELPAGYQDADLEMAGLQNLARRESQLKKQGICAHGWCQGHPDGTVTCNECKEVFPNEVARDEARYDALN